FGLGATSSSTFVINNSSGTLNIGSILITGANASQYSLTTLPSTLSLVGSASTSFIISFTAAYGGPQNATVNIYNNDCSDPIYNFVISASAPLASALDLDGFDDCISLPANGNIPVGNSPYTLEAKIKPDVHGVNGIIGWGNFGTNNQTNAFRLGTGGSTGYRVYNYWFGNDIYMDVPNLADGNWHHVAATWDGTTRKIYLDGTLMNSDNPGSNSVPNNGSMFIGMTCAWCGGEYFDGQIDEVRVWNYARTQCELRTYKDCEIPGASTGLVLNYHLNQGSSTLANPSVTTAIDASSNNITGGLVNMSMTGTVSNWVSPGSVVNNYTVPAVPSESIVVTGSAVVIANNSSTGSAGDGTDFGSASSRTFVIQNGNSGTLTINSVSLAGVNASEFSVTSLPGTTLAGSATTTFVIAFTPTASGIRTASVVIDNSDCTQGLFKYTIEGKAPTASALDFDGTDDYVDCGTDPSLDITTGTWETWVKLNSLVSPQRLFFKEVADATYGGMYELFFSGGYFFAELKIGAVNHQIQSTTSLTANTWYHAAATYDGTAFKLYVNGILEATDFTASGPMNPGTGHLCLGATGTNPLTAQLQAQMDETRLWNVARTQCEIQTYMNCEIPSASSGLLLNYHFNQGSHNLNNSSVTTLSNSASAINHGTLMNFALTGTTSNWVAPGSVANGFTTSTAPTASIGLTGNGNTITYNSTTPLSSNHTDFGSVANRTFVITNTSGSGTLQVGSPYITGIDAAQFSVTVLPSTSTLSSLASTSFVVAFTPTAGGIKNATVNIGNNDCAKPLFSFAIQGTPPLASALDFDGIDDYIQIPGAPSLSFATATDITVEAMVQFTANHSGFHGVVVNADPVGSWYGYQLAIVQNKVAAEVVTTLGSLAIPQGLWGTKVLNDGQWHHLAMVVSRSAGTVRLYVDGMLEATATHTGLVGNINSYSPVFIGTERTQAGFFTGKMDEVRIWNTARSQCDIQSFMNCEITTNANLVANYHFNQGSANLDNTAIISLIDGAGSNTGVLDNFTLLGVNSNWVSPSNIVNGFTTSVAPTVSIGVTGNGNTVAFNSTTVSTSNHTDFGSITTRTFVISNVSGSGTLNIGTPYLTGINASEFSVTVIPLSNTLISLASTSFVVAFTPTAGGPRSATVNISNNDCSKPIFSFAIQGAAPTASALTFDGVDDYIDAPSTGFSTGNNDMTFEFWVKLKSAQTGHRWITSLGSSVSGSLMTVGFDGSNNNKIRIHHFGPDLMASTASITPNVWTHVAVNYRGATYSSDIFINGVFVESLSFGQPLSIPVNPAFQIGTYVSNSAYCPNMDLDELRVWNRALCQAEIQNNMSCEITTTAPGLVANYHFNQGSVAVDNSTVTTVTDLSGSANNGTLSGFSYTGTVSNWSGPGAVNSGSSCTVYLNPEINLVGNGQNISDGDITPQTADNTNFGSVCANTVTTKTFTIQNTGTGTLSVASITMSGADAASFTVSAISPASPLAAGASATFAVTFTPTSTGVKNATINIPSNDCDESTYDFVLTGTCNAIPSVSVSTSNSIICNGFTTSVNGSGADTYTWTGGTPAATNAVAFSPTITTSYTLSGTNTLTGCSSTNAPVQTITVNPIPTVTANTTSSLMCSSGTVALTGSGADTYTWAGGAPTVTNGLAFNPTVTASYTVSGTYTLTGCVSTNVAVQTISVNPTPTVAIAINSNVVCFGGAPTLTATGASTYTWNPGNFTTAVINPTPAVTTTYTLTGNSPAGCTSTNLALQIVTVNPLPVVTATATSYSVCLGATTAVNANGATNYTWTSSLQNNVPFSPNSTDSYTVTGVDGNNCQNSASLTITVDALPSVTANITATSVCAGGSITLIGSGASTYSWSGGVTDNQAFVPATTNSYTLTGVSPAGCTSTNAPVVSVTVNPLPNITANTSHTSICLGYVATLNGSGAVNYVWSDGVTDNVSFSPTVTTVYTVTGTDGNTCQNTATVSITVNSLPSLSVTTTNTAACEAESNTLIVSGASTYSWSTSETDTAIVVSPTTTTNYTVTGIAITGCSNTVVYTQSVNPCLGTLTAITSNTHVSCGSRKDGAITLSVTNSYTSSQLSYIWTPSSLCPGNDCPSLNNLDAGIYSVTVKVTYTLGGILVKTDSIVMNPIVIDKQITACDLRVFNGLTPNADGENDTWQIENIDQFPNNKVTVFNRWGEKVFEISGYNNIDKAWPLNGDSSKLISSTYFYIIDPGDGSKVLKGWVELIKK
ncbi:MAG: choice-of-anchor D domain-containing protein, partial [Bacteroidia bacterium]|nr:choice-of-anchor D domain-containing protein [Bacteroidia bacterium]